LTDSPTFLLADCQRAHKKDTPTRHRTKYGYAYAYAYATVMRLSFVCLSVSTECIVESRALTIEPPRHTMWSRRSQFVARMADRTAS